MGGCGSSRLLRLGNLPFPSSQPCSHGVLHRGLPALDGRLADKEKARCCGLSLSCAEEDSNLHPVIPDQALNLARLPIPPSAQGLAQYSRGLLQRRPESCSLTRSGRRSRAEETRRGVASASGRSPRGRPPPPPARRSRARSRSSAVWPAPPMATRPTPAVGSEWVHVPPRTQRRPSRLVYARVEVATARDAQPRRRPRRAGRCGRPHDRVAVPQSARRQRLGGLLGPFRPTRLVDRHMVGFT